MASQINFYLHPDDYYDFDIFLKSFGPVLFIPDLHYQDTITTVTNVIPTGVKGEPNRIYLVMPNYYTGFELKEFKQHTIWLINDNNLPVLHFDRCNFRHDSEWYFIGSGRLYYEAKYVVNGKWISKPENFKKWAEKIIRATTQQLFKHKFPIKGTDQMETCYVGSNALTWAIENKAEFRTGSLGLYSTL